MAKCNNNNNNNNDNNNNLLTVFLNGSFTPVILTKKMLLTKSYKYSKKNWIQVNLHNTFK